MTGTKRESVVDYLRTLRENAAPGAHLASVQSIQDEIGCSIATAVYGVVAAREAGVAVRPVTGSDGGYFAITEAELLADLAALGSTSFERKSIVLHFLITDLIRRSDAVIEKTNLVRSFLDVRTAEDAEFFDSVIESELASLRKTYDSMSSEIDVLNGHLADLDAEKESTDA